MKRMTCLAVAILAIGNVAFAGLSDGLVAYYPFNGNANDESGNGHHGSVQGDTTLTQDRFGVAGRAYYFDGENDYIDVGSDPALAPETFSVSAWFKPSLSSTPDHWTIYGMAYTSFAQQYLVGIEWTDTSVLGFLVVSNWLYGTTRLDNGTWYHGVFTRDGNIGRIFLNGELEAESNAMSGAVSNNRSLPYFIGGCYEPLGASAPANWEFEGSIDEVRIYNRSLSADEIRGLAVVPAPGAVVLAGIGASLVGWLRRRRYV